MSDFILSLKIQKFLHRLNSNVTQHTDLFFIVFPPFFGLNFSSIKPEFEIKETVAE